MDHYKLPLNLEWSMKKHIFGVLKRMRVRGLLLQDKNENFRRKKHFKKFRKVWAYPSAKITVTNQNVFCVRKVRNKKKIVWSHGGENLYDNVGWFLVDVPLSSCIVILNTQTHFESCQNIVKRTIVFCDVLLQKYHALHELIDNFRYLQSIYGSLVFNFVLWFWLFKPSFIVDVRLKINFFVHIKCSKEIWDLPVPQSAWS